MIGEVEMNQRNEENDVFKASHMTILISYTFFSAILIGESFLMDWEKWAIILILAGTVLAWIMHIQQRLNEGSRLWLYSVMMMATYFFYGIHLTSTFDIALVMSVVIMIYSMTGVKSLIKLCQATFAITFGYDIIAMVRSGEKFGRLEISRSFMHVAMVILAGIVARTIIDNWSKVLSRSHDEIEELKAATERLDNFLANVSHEIRTPVNAVMGLSAVLEKENLPEAVLSNVNAISGAGHRVSEQIGDILDFTEIDMNKLSVNNETYMINSLINDLLVQLSFTEDYDLDLVIDMEPNIPAEITGDASKIKKILWHLIVNGFKFTKEGGVNVHIYPVKREYGINLVLEVQDTGVGMNEEEVEHAYEKFYQSDSGRTRTAGGLGLGIPIVNGFTKAMNGVLAIESAEGEGTTVRVSIPQTVDNPIPCLSVKDRENCIAAGFLGFMTTGHQSIREYYMRMIAHLSLELGVAFRRVQSREELEKLIATEKITHLFVGTGEYLENRELIDTIARKMNVAVVADRGFTGPVGHGLSLLPKPFYGGQIVSFLNHAFDGVESDKDEKMTTPGLRALVVDDEPMNLLVAKGIFETYGMIVSTASGGREAIGMCAQEDYDIIFMDHMMPEMDGVEAMKRLRFNAARLKKELCIVALTANAISSAKEMFLSEGFDGFIPKPIEITEFERVLKKILPKSAIVYEKVEIKPDIVREGTAPADKESADKAGTDNAAIKEQETAAPQNTARDKYDAIRKLGVDVEKGMVYCRGEDDFYKQLLAEYAKNYKQKIDDVAGFYDAANWKDYAIKVHAIKSTSKMIGAMDLSEAARVLEEAAKAGNEDTVREGHAEFIQKYESLLRAISEMLGLVSAESADTGDVLEFAPDAEEEVIEFSPDEEDGALEFTPEGE